MRILVTPTFERAVKKLHRPQKADPYVYKFRMVHQLCLLFYRLLEEGSLKLLTVGPHENFYRDLKRLEN
ncbi:type II toxin-antitoxin system RelE/ParE family toxin [Propionivibrio limicola]|uniref:type II toxin-antitoxin system RelE/ParE family toxin n=1 Tax=Propionivibrio limicola TaxID=167645 RepID=UPI001290F235|nr:type II toxin-antitoxin system RelE/ParE family toxin [Propionivibrio limicola]